MDSMWSNILHLVQVVEAQASPKSTEADAEDEEESELSEYVLLKDFNRLAYRLYKKDIEDAGEDEEEEDGAAKWSWLKDIKPILNAIYN